MIRGIFAPPAESNLNRTEFKQRKEGQQEDIQTYVTSKICLFEQAFGPDERHFPTLFDEVLSGLYNKVVMRKIRERNPATQAEMINQLLEVVEAEGDCVHLRCVESTSLSGLTLSTTQYQRQLSLAQDL